MAGKRISTEVTKLLEEMSLEALGPKLEALGVRGMQDLALVDDADLVRWGLSTIERRRFFAGSRSALGDAGGGAGARSWGTSLLAGMKMDVAHSHMLVTVEARVETRLGDTVYLVGSCIELGMWDPACGAAMSTDQDSYPVWRVKLLLDCSERSLEYKLVVRHGSSGGITWETFAGDQPNRVLALFAGYEVCVPATWCHPFEAPLRYTKQTGNHLHPLERIASDPSSFDNAMIPDSQLATPPLQAPRIVPADTPGPPPAPPSLLPKVVSREPSMLDLTVTSGSRNGSFNLGSPARSPRASRAPMPTSILGAAAAAAGGEQAEPPRPRRIISHLNAGSPLAHGSISMGAHSEPPSDPHSAFDGARAMALLAAAAPGSFAPSAAHASTGSTPMSMFM